MDLLSPISTALQSIRGKLYLAFLAFSLFMSAFGLYAINSIRDTSELVTRTYDKPLMAINFARSALYGFGAMDRELVRVSLIEDPKDRELGISRIEELRNTFDDDLKVALERSLSERSVLVILEIFDLMAEWHGQRESAVPDGIDGGEWAVLDSLAERIVDKFELLIDLTAGDGFLIRQNALQAIESSTLANVVAIAAILALSLLVTVFLSRSILGPLGAAVRVAERISRGELDARIPSPGRDETGTLLRSLAVMQENLRAMMAQEVALRKSAQSQLADALENSSDGVILLDAEERILTVNGQVLALFPQIAHHFVPGSSFREALAEARRRGLYEYGSYDESDQLERPATEASPPRAIRVADGRWLKVNRSAARSGSGSVVIWSDITELKLREEHLQAAKEEAEKASEAKTKFLATISHELRTPLNAIIGFSELIATEALGKAGIRQYVEYAADIQSSGSHLLGIINDILDIAHSEAGTLSLRPEPMDVAAEIETCRRLVQRQCEGAGHTLAVEIEQELPEIEADPGRIRQILLNLVSNAIKFTPEGGRITVRASPAADGGVDIAVADTGIGMKPEDVALALEPFRQIDNALSRKYEGTGLGLPLTKSLVELHAGTFHIESSPGVGTTIAVHLPPHPGIAAEAAHERRYGVA